MSDFTEKPWMDFYYSERQKEIKNNSLLCREEVCYVNGVEYTEIIKHGVRKSNFEDAVLVYSGFYYKTEYKEPSRTKALSISVNSIKLKIQTATILNNELRFISKN